jgi:hypothetical protein
MLLRAACLVLPLVVLATLVSAPTGHAQSRQGDLSELWKEHPLDPRVEGPRPVGAREERGSTAGPPPSAAKPAGSFPLALLFLALALAVVGIAGGAVQGIGRLRERRRGRAGSGLGAGAGNLGR